MKVIQGAFRLFIAWIVILFLLFGTTVIYKVSSASNEIQEIAELHEYNGYRVRKLKTDWFGNWVIIRKGRDEVVLKCSDSVYSQLAINDQLGR